MEAFCLCCRHSPASRMEDVVSLKSMDDSVLPELRVAELGGDDWETSSVKSRAIKVGAEFDVNVVKGEVNEFGLYLSVVDGLGLLVHSVKDGLVHEWNKSHPDLEVMKGDCIVMVNGISRDPMRFVELVKSEPMLNLKVKRATTFLVKIEREPENRLGLDISHLPDDKSLIVNDVSGGHIAHWNGANPHHEVRRGDRIVKVNATCNNARRMLTIIEEERSLRLLMFRIEKLSPPPPPQAQAA
eukprot:NODE_12534_length_1219_cov_4.102564.p1 GENE.NODE_12534_length_1219_cov_4.102564~~NODE_12534_length_1219_cov_4.102564.p1  ORF type:complete len:242 (-),score=71.89 NODE_12534_length_1219_cov_4.102564:441-1166(-)